ncbi:MAG: ABC transporter permease [Phycisphaerales bacterium]|nr:ABC transporter permease [Phycisphaerales bacterium]|tara:strand:+ start:15341 stop:16054 length:714 start_codon:yes stop_codon:yes gene_type:complete
MRGLLTIAQRDFRALFYSPSGYVVAALFALISGIVFMRQVFLPGQPASMSTLLDFDALLLLFICPALTMRSICEERRQGTWELLVAAPPSMWGIVAGKYIASFGFLIVLLLLTMPCVVLLEVYGRPDPGEIFSGYLGVACVGGLYLASGIVASTIAGSQTIAFLLTVFFWILVGLARVGADLLGPGLADILFAIEPYSRLQDFTSGLIDTANIIYFLAGILMFLMISTAILELGRRR